VPGPQELLLIALVALFVLGPERLPEAARSAARMLARIRRYGVSATKDFKGMAALGEIETEVQELRRELNRTRTELRRAVRQSVTPPRPLVSPLASTDGPDDPVAPAETEGSAAATADAGGAPLPEAAPVAEEAGASAADDATGIVRGERG
jgi:sec-independent protein translocase protein TatB